MALPDSPQGGNESPLPTEIEKLKAQLATSRKARREACSKLRQAAGRAPATERMRRLQEEEEAEDMEGSGVRSMPDPQERLEARRRALAAAREARRQRADDFKRTTERAVKSTHYDIRPVLPERRD